MCVHVRFFPGLSFFWVASGFKVLLIQILLKKGIDFFLTHMLNLTTCKVSFKFVIFNGWFESNKALSCCYLLILEFLNLLL